MSTISKSAKLDGSSQYFNVADNAALRVVNGWTVEMWVRMNAVGQGGSTGYVAYSRSGENGWGITFTNTSGTTYVVRPEAGSGAFTGADGSINVNDGAWHHIRVYFNGASTKVYVDGTQDGTTLSIPNITNPSSTVYFGSKAGAVPFFSGQIALIRIWNNEHTAADSATVYGTATTHLNAEWTLDNALTDGSGNALTLTNTGSTPFWSAAPPSLQDTSKIYFDCSSRKTTGNSTTSTVALAATGSNSYAFILSENGGGASGTTDDFVSCTVGGSNASQIDTGYTNASTRYFRCFIYPAPASSTNYTVTSSTATAQQENAIAVAIYNNVNQTGQPDSYAHNNATGNVTASTTVVASSCWVVSGGLGGGQTLTAGAGNTIKTGGTASSGLAIGDSDGIVSTGSQSITWNNPNGSTRTDAFIVSFSPVVVLVSTSVNDAATTTENTNVITVNNVHNVSYTRLHIRG